MWHHRSVFPLPSLRLGIAACILLLPSPGGAQQSAQSKNPSAFHPASSNEPRNPLGDLKLLIQEQAVAVDQGDPPTIALASRRLNAQIYRLLAQFRLVQGKPRESIALYRQSLDLQPSTERRLEFASALLRSGNAAAALTESEAVIASEPRNAIAWTTRGSALRDLGRGEEAVPILNHALQLRSDPNVAFALGATYLSLRQKEKAATVFHHLLEASDNSPLWFVAIGDSYRDAGYMEDAVTNLKAALARDPKVLHGEFFLGLTYLQMNQWGPNSDSFLHLRRAVAQSPREYIGNFYLGALESTDGSDLAASDKHLQAAAEADSSQPEVWLYLGMNANREKRVADAKIFLQKSIDLTGTDESRNNYQVRRAYFSLGRLLIAQGDRPAGEALLTRYKTAEQAAVAESGKSIVQNAQGMMKDSPLESLAAVAPPAVASTASGPEVSSADRLVQAAAEDKLQKLLAGSLNDLGTAEARQHDYAAALHDFQEAERWHASDPIVLRNLGTAAFRMKDNAEAARALQIYIDQLATIGRPIDEHAQLMLALSDFAEGRFAEAASSFGTAPALVMQDPSTAYSYAFALARTGHAQEANRIADTLTSQTLDSQLLPLVCHLYIDTENYNGSQACYRKALETEPALSLAHYEIGESLIHLDHPSEAIPELRQELLLTPGNPNVQTALAFALLQTSQKDEARTLLQTTVASHPEHADAQYEYGKLMLEEGKIAESVAHLELSEKDDPSKDYVHYQLGTAYKKAGEVSEAEREFHIYREIKDKNRNVTATPH